MESKQNISLIFTEKKSNWTVCPQVQFVTETAQRFNVCISLQTQKLFSLRPKTITKLHPMQLWSGSWADVSRGCKTSEAAGILMRKLNTTPALHSITRFTITVRPESKITPPPLAPVHLFKQSLRKELIPKPEHIPSTAHNPIPPSVWSVDNQEVFAAAALSGSLRAKNSWRLQTDAILFWKC